MMIAAFDFASSPHLVFGPSKRNALPNVVRNYGSKVLLVRGAQSLAESPPGKHLLQLLSDKAFQLKDYCVKDEPTPAAIDHAVSLFSAYDPDVVVGVGGGSVLDAAKAISAMLPLKESVKEYLEGVGTKTHPGTKVPFVAMPTTAGTGSEATKNAVISVVGPQGFKKSLRHNRFVPEFAIIDPELAISCPRTVTAASGMDAFTQLLESFVSTNANPITDALALQGLTLIRRSLLRAFQEPENLEARTEMALAAYLSGLALANAGLGLVHGYAASVGGFFSIGHGNICSRIMGPANTLTVKKLRLRNEERALSKYASVGRIFSGDPSRSAEYYIDFLLEYISNCTAEMQIPGLSAGGVNATDFERIVRVTDNKFNPIGLDDAEKTEILKMSL
jgi:alcohol dehydrogenase class IV